MAQGSISINGNRFPFESEQTILQVAEENRIGIPTLGYLKGALPAGGCRICVMAVEGARSLVVACSTPAVDGMAVHIESPRVVASRREILELLLASGNHNCTIGSTRENNWTALQMQTSASDGAEDLCPAWQTGGMSRQAGLMVPEMMDGLVSGRGRGFYIFGENLANTEPDIHKVEHEQASAEFMVVQDILQNETNPKKEPACMR